MLRVVATLALIAAMPCHAAPRTAAPVVETELATSLAMPGHVTFADDSLEPALRMALSGGRPTGGTPGALSSTFDGEIATNLSDIMLDETLEDTVVQVPQLSATMSLPPLAGAWLLGLTRPPVLLPEPFSYSILSIGLLGFIISRGFRREP